MVWDSAIFPQQNSGLQQTRLSVMIGGEHNPDWQQLTDEDLRRITLSALSKHLHIHATPDVFIVNRKINAIPQYAVGHQEKVHSIEKQLNLLSPNLFLLGTSFYGVAVNECIAKASDITRI
jgi:oxygen-dependent protoporphyrinogen oxidase